MPRDMDWISWKKAERNTFVTFTGTSMNDDWSVQFAFSLHNRNMLESFLDNVFFSLVFIGFRTLKHSVVIRFFFYFLTSFLFFFASSILRHTNTENQNGNDSGS